MDTGKRFIIVAVFYDLLLVFFLSFFLAGIDVMLEGIQFFSQVD